MLLAKVRVRKKPSLYLPCTNKHMYYNTTVITDCCQVRVKHKTLQCDKCSKISKST